MFPEGQGAPRAFVRDGAAAKRTNELLEIASTAINELFKQRGYDRSRPFPRCGGGRGRSVSWGAGASPTAAHWAVAEQSTKVRSSPRASNSPHFCLILTFCLLLLPLSGPVCALQHLTVAPTRRQAHPQRPCRPPGRSRSRSRRHRACSWARWPPAASIGRTFLVVIFRCDRDRCESVCNGTWGLVVRIPAARGRAGGVNETYYDRYVHQGCLWGRP